MKLDLEKISKEELFQLLLEEQKKSNEKSVLLENQKTEYLKAKSFFEQEITYKNHVIAQYQRMLYGSKRERFESVDSNQMKLPFEEYATKEEKEDETFVEEKISYIRTKKKKKHKGRNPLPPHLPEVVYVVEPTESTEGFKKIGEERTEILEYAPANFFKLVIVRPKYALINQEEDIELDETKKQVIIGELPSRPIEKCLAGNRLLSSILIQKFEDHLPFYRQIKIFKRSEVDISQTTIDSWVSLLGDLFKPLYKMLIRETKAQTYLQADETTIKVLDNRLKGKTHQGYYWVYYSPLAKLVCVNYQEGRSIEDARLFLEDYKGTLQTDGYNVYEHYYSKNNNTHLACWAHVRRKFDEAKEIDKKRASYALKEIQKLYLIEREIMELSPKDKKKIRLDKALPIINNLGKWLVKEQKNVLPQYPIGKAIAYTINLWDSLSNYLYDGNYMIDNNLIENKIRPIALGRKNYLFAGSHNGATRSAMFYSFIGSCKINEINPMLWFEYVLENIQEWKMNKLHELLPNNIDKEELKKFKPFYER